MSRMEWDLEPKDERITWDPDFATKYQEPLNDWIEAKNAADENYSNDYLTDVAVMAKVKLLSAIEEYCKQMKGGN